MVSVSKGVKFVTYRSHKKKGSTIHTVSLVLQSIENIRELDEDSKDKLTICYYKETLWLFKAGSYALSLTESD